MKQRNYSLDVCRLVAAIWIVTCHADIFIEAGDGIYRFFARFIPRVGVAFFFAMSGYYYLKSIEKKGIFKKQLLSLLKVYAAWSVVYYMASFVVNVVMGDEPIGQFLIERVIFFVTRGSYSHFWFFTAIIYATILSTLFYKLFGKKGICALACISFAFFLLGNLGSSYYEIGIEIPVVQDWISKDRDTFEVFRGIFCMGLPYFMMGYFINLLEERFQKMKTSSITILFVIIACLYFGESYLLSNVWNWYQYPEVFFTLYPFAFIILMVLLRNPKPEWEPFAGTAKRLSGYMYYIHPLLILIIQIVSEKMEFYVPSVVMSLVVVGIILASGLALLKLGKKISFVNYFI